MEKENSILEVEQNNENTEIYRVECTITSKNERNSIKIEKIYL